MTPSACGSIILVLILAGLSGCAGQPLDHEAAQKIVVTTPQVRSVTIPEHYVCQIHARRHIRIRALERGYLKTISIKEGQTVKEGTPMFQLAPMVYKAKLDVESAERDVAKMQFEYTKNLSDEKVVAVSELALSKAKLASAEAKVRLAQAEFDFATIKAPFDGIVDRLMHQQGSLVEEGDELTTLSDTSVMWVYFNVPEARYLDYLAESDEEKNQDIELDLANHRKFSQVGKIMAIEGEFNNQTGNVAFRADFPNPDRVLRHGQTGTVVIRHVKDHAIVIPQRATFQLLDKRCVFVVDKDHVAHEREIEIADELDDVFTVSSGVTADDRIVLEGSREIRDGDRVDYREISAADAFKNLKYHAE